jgi:PleD family two-component response regulator
VRCSCSIGVSETAAQDDGIERVLQRADAALYEAKRSGRNCWKSRERDAATGVTAR